MRVFLADYEWQGHMWCIEFMAPDYETAEVIANEKGWVLLGTKEGQENCPADVAAMYERIAHNKALH